MLLARVPKEAQERVLGLPSDGSNVTTP